MLGNLFKAFFAWGNGFLRTERRSLSNSSKAIWQSKEAFPHLRRGVCQLCRLPPKQSVERQESDQGEYR